MDSKYQLISFNKEFIATKDFNLGLDNRAFRYGDGFFETMHANGLEVQFIEDHFARTLAASKILMLKLPDFLTVGFLKKQIGGLLSRCKLFQAARIKLTIYRTGEGFYIPNSNTCDIVIEATFLGKGYYELNTNGINIGIYDENHTIKSTFSSIKSINAQQYILAGIFAQRLGFDDVLLLNDNGLIVEATSSNIFAVKDKAIYTPSVNSGCVNGIMRKQILQIATELGYSIDADAKIKPNDLLEMDELFLTNAIVGIKYVSGYKSKRYFKRVAQKLTLELNKKAFSNSYRD